jgi:predicted membrane-bound spermidine synthase
MTSLLCGIFFLSGASALVFETLWFYQAGLAFGNSIWASSLVTAAFMGGLALGNALAGRRGHRIARPLRAYALLELAIGGLGLALVHALPALTPLLARALGPLVDAPALLNPLRLALAFALLLAPATAMGATLPLMVRALHRHDARFGRVLGRLYGWNTLGAVVGALVGEALLVERLGIRGTGLVALAANAAAAAGALALARREEAVAAAREARALPALPRAAWGVLAGAFVAGFVLLALEVVWFRIALLHVRGDSLAFATMLAVVLAGIGIGGLAGGRLLGWRPGAARGAPALALAAGALAVLAYALLDAPRAGAPWARAAEVALRLMFPVALASGALFALLGEALDRLAPAETRSAGLLTLANTTGAMLGPLVAGFALLPRAGIERSLHALAAAYAFAALAPWLAGVRPEGRAARGGLAAAAAAYAFALALFPSGALRERHLSAPLAYWERAEGARPVAIREGLTETILYLERPLLGEPRYHRMLTNSYTMSSSSFFAKRYMKLFVWWPLAIHPDPKSALLISYGVGNTARALVDTRSLEQIHVVDISRDAIEMSRIAFPDASRWPPADPRVRVHIEDGRYFLQTTRERFDLITGEPPPPKLAGVVGLYTREHFALVRDRLADGGIATWWLPVHGLLEADAKAIVGAFCAAFEDCSLWRGSGFDWILAGTRGARGPGSRERFASLWRDPGHAPELAELGVESPEQLGALFIAGPDTLREFSADVPPLDDDHPRRLTRPLAGREHARKTWSPWLDPRLSRERFAQSALIEALWPAPLRDQTLAWFDVQGEIDRVFENRVGDPVAELPAVHRLLTTTSLRALPLWLLGSDPDEQRAVRAAAAKGAGGSPVEYRLALAALAERRFDEAAMRLGRVLALGQPPFGALELRIYALAMAGRREEASRLTTRVGVERASPEARGAFRAFLADTFGIPGAARGASDR